MIFESIELRDFRGISELNLPIDKKLTVIVGENGVGKTSVLDSISLLLSGLRYLWIPLNDQKVNAPWPSFAATDVTMTKDDFSIRATVSVKEQNGNLSTKSLKLGGDRVNNITAVSALKPDNKARLAPAVHPLFVYYRQDRGFNSDSSRTGQDVLSYYTVRNQSISKNLYAIPDLSDWWDKRDAQEARQHRDLEPGYKDRQLEAVRKLIVEMEEFEGISYEATLTTPGLYLHKKGGQKIHVDQLSSGERVYLILLADLARRLQIIDPNSNLDGIPGIVLIDEIELNLHPKWQRRIIPTLTSIFKSCQFIVTTHSPQVVGEVKSDNIRILSISSDQEIEYINFNGETLGRDSNEILVKILGASERDEEMKSRLEDLESMISNNELEQARMLLCELKSSIDGSLVELDIAEQRLRRRESVEKIETFK